MQKPGLFGMNGFMVFLLTCFSFAVRAQQPEYLILVDAENKQPFVVRLGEQSYFSSGQGHLVLSRLKDSIYKLGLRFPRKNISEQVFTVAIHRKDLGFQLKGNDSSIVLFNWQTKEIIRPVYEKDSSRLLEQGIKRDDGFSRLMSAVVNDTAVMYNTYMGDGFGPDSAIANVRNPKPSAQSQTPDVSISRSEQRSASDPPTSEIAVPAKQTSVAISGSVAQINQLSNVNQQPATVNKDSIEIAKTNEMHFQDSLNTVRKTASRDSLISARKQQNFLRDSLNTARKTAIKDSMATAKKRQVFLKDSLVAARKDANDGLDSLKLASGSTAGGQHSTLTNVKKLREVSLKISRKMVFLDIGKDGRADTITLFVFFEQVDTVINKRPGREPVAIKKPLPQDSAGMKKVQLTTKGLDTTNLSKTSTRQNSTKTTDALTCGQAATESDTETLRSSILKANSEQEKIAVAASAFAIKCYSVSQVRFLASLLVSDKAKYGLMDAAHLHITDREHFPELVDMLTDKNFQRKFLVMAEKRS